MPVLCVDDEPSGADRRRRLPVADRHDGIAAADRQPTRRVREVVLDVDHDERGAGVVVHGWTLPRGLEQSLDNASVVDIVTHVTTTAAPGATPPLPRTALHILNAIGPEERHGYAIMGEVARISGGAVRLGPGAIYTTLRRLVDDGLIEESDERPDPELDDQRRRYYRLTALGRSVATAEVRRLELLVRSAQPWTLEAGG
jgi:DNA-binding PadR family transcriptional regulator